MLGIRDHLSTLDAGVTGLLDRLARSSRAWRLYRRFSNFLYRRLPGGASQDHAAADFMLPPGYVPRLTPGLDDHTLLESDGVVWQPDVYVLAARLATLAGARRIIDIGCGHAEKLVAASSGFEIVGVDLESNVAHCRETYPSGTWIAADLETAKPDRIEPPLLEDAILVCAGSWSIWSPRLLLHCLRSWLETAHLAALTTPDRVLYRVASISARRSIPIMCANGVPTSSSTFYGPRDSTSGWDSPAAIQWNPT